MTLAYDLVLAALLLGLAGFAILARTGFAAVIGFMAFGLLLTLAWVQLGGIDVALTEAAIGGGLTGALMIRAAARLRASDAGAAPGGVTRVAAALLALAVTLGLSLAVLAFPQTGPTLAPLAMANIGATGVGNPITAVLLAFRSMDTLLEAIVLVLALVGVWSLAPDSAWGGRPGPRQRYDANSIMTYAARILPPIGTVVALYVFWAGADAPGGKFQGATLLAAMALLVWMAGLIDAPETRQRWLRAGLVAGALVFIAIGFVGSATAGAFLAYPPGLAKPLIIVIEAALLPSLALILALLLIGRPAR